MVIGGYSLLFKTVPFIIIGYWPTLIVYNMFKPQTEKIHHLPSLCVMDKPDLPGQTSEHLL